MISFVYFDLGGVVVKDFSNSNKWDLLMKDLGIPDDGKVVFNNIWGASEKEICTTKEVDRMIPVLEKELHIEIPHTYPLLNTFVKYFEKNEIMQPLLTKIKSHSRVGLLTNMYVGMFSKILEEEILPPINWDMVIDSSVVGYAKPDEKIYTIAQEKVHVSPEEILFVDNNRKNVSAAEALGWQTFFYDSSDYPRATKELSEYMELQFPKRSY